MNRKKQFERLFLGVFLGVVCAFLIWPAEGSAVSEAEKAVIGIWNGTLKVPGLDLRLVFKIKETPEGTLTGTMDSIDQGAELIPVDSIQVAGGKVRFDIRAVNSYFEGVFDDQGKLIGKWHQNGMAFPLNLQLSTEAMKLKRPQEPKAPFPYNSEEVAFINSGADITLSGTLTFPKTKGLFPAAILISGSGPQDRDETVMGHKPFLVLSDYLTRSGIAVLRYDDRGTGKSQGEFSTATTQDFATDAEAAMAFLKTRKEIDPDRIGFIGHSEGGLIAPMLAVKHPETAFIVLMAGPGVTGEQILMLQSELIARAQKVDPGIIAIDRKIQSGLFELMKKQQAGAKSGSEIRQYLRKALAGLTQEQRESLSLSEEALMAQVKRLNSPWFRFFLTYDPAPTLMRVECPVLAIIGDKDLQVPADQNLPAIEKALKSGGNRQFLVRKLRGLNHLFQRAETGAPTEYAKIEQTISPVALSTIGNWIRSVCGLR